MEGKIIARCSPELKKALQLIAIRESKPGLMKNESDVIRELLGNSRKVKAALKEVA